MVMEKPQWTIHYSTFTLRHTGFRETLTKPAYLLWRMNEDLDIQGILQRECPNKTEECRTVKTREKRTIWDRRVRSSNSWVQRSRLNTKSQNTHSKTPISMKISGSFSGRSNWWTGLESEIKLYIDCCLCTGRPGQRDLLRATQRVKLSFRSSIDSGMHSRDALVSRNSWSVATEGLGKS